LVVYEDMDEWDDGDDEYDEEEQHLLERLRTTKERVEYILAKYPDARNSDLYLIILYIRKFVPELARYIRYVPYDVIKKYDGLFESVRRARQYVQNTLGKYPPTDEEVMKQRKRKERALRKIIGGEKM